MSIVLIALVHLLQILLSLLNSVVIPLQYLCVQNELSLHIRVQCIVCFPAISRIRPNPLDVLNISAVICNETRLLNVFVYSITSFVTLSSTRKAHHSIIFIFERLPFFLLYILHVLQPFIVALLLLFLLPYYKVQAYPYPHVYTPL